MGERTSYFLKRFIYPLIAYILLVYGWIDFVAKPFVSLPSASNITWRDAFLDLFSAFPRAYGWLGAGYVWLLCTFLVLFVSIIFILRPIRAVLKYLDHSESPLSVLRTDIVLDFNENWSNCELKRVQLLHANKPGLNAYEYNLVSHKGTIEIKSLRSILNDINVTKKIHDTRRGSVLECIEEYNRTLPFSFWATYLPDYMVYLLFNVGLFNKTVLKRSIVTIDRDEYNGPNPSFEIHARNYVSHIEIKLQFPDGFEPSEGVLAKSIQESTISDKDVIRGYEDGKQIYEVRCSRLKPGQIVRLTWVPN